MSKSRKNNKVAYLEEAENDSGSSLEGRAGTRVYACADDLPTPPKEQPNTSKSRRGESSAAIPEGALRPVRKDRSDSRRDSHARRYIETDDGEMDRRYRESDRRAKAERDSAQAHKKKARPNALRHAATQPVVQQTHRRSHHDGPSAYGVPQPAASGSRPRASTRPASYYAGQTRPPPPPSGPWPQSPMPFPVSSYPPPPMFPGGPPPIGVHGGPPPPSPGGMPPAWYDSGPPTPHHVPRDLRKRFDPRPSSAIGFHNGPPSYHADDYSDYDDPPYLERHASRSKRQQEEDRKRMPPPPTRNMPRRPSTTANPSTPFQPPAARPPSRQGQSRPPRPLNRRSVGFADQRGYDDDDLLGGDSALFHDISPEPSFNQKRRSMTRAHRELHYDDDEYDIIPSSGRVSRRGSVYERSPLGSGGASLGDDGHDNRYLDAMKYQEDVSGGPQVPLTAETLRKANKRGDGVASSRSTRSSASRDDSEHKRSNTTGITRSSSGGHDDITTTIKVSGGAVVRLGGAEISCAEDSEITVTNGQSMLQGGSDQGSTVYPQLEDSPSRFEHKTLPMRSRTPSQADSHIRGYPPTHAPYDPQYRGGYF